MKIQRIAKRLDEAAMQSQATFQLTGDDAVTLEEAYAVQRALIELRLERGGRQVGLKMGFTSRAKMAQMGVSDLIWGRLTSDMWIEEGSAISLSDYVHPRVEPEICFLLKHRLSGNVTPLEAMAAVEAVAPALEVIDSRYRDFKFSLPDVVADNASSSGFVVGPWHAPDTDVSNVGIVMSFDGRPVELGSTAAILGAPVRGLVAAARLAAAQNEALEPGSLVLAGAATAAVALKPGTAVRCEFQGLGSVAFTTRPEE
ncbi:4-oxalocrotonate decarboxylase [Paraburkholderia nemoris]|uniref:2-keto-4-pentenoate hydratase n=1 Tax=Paraburkholderia nemoris TaxID=2793076 RepID=UPI0019142575|nr:fumarylacetoacetate hydrolase family protein [Paraburkholderia nemoris]MBK5151361.1 fumarylacetoacetate hydrolase family protein [Burkholderia sp. R-69608]CAE6952225.1 4-oxalocrotonate decarboxylase [Paraburkholderia nemoris]